MPRKPRSAPGSPRTAAELLDMTFLELRSHLLETAAGLDRIERAKGGREIFRDPRLQKICRALNILKARGANRAERFLHLFSD
ncbi:MAG: hypothetical protein N3A66_10255 [Planctomycetota bacterium]|nr:hypothetical protein [Planctomycetota bacterium]